MTYAIDDRVIAALSWRRGTGWGRFASLKRRGKVVAVTPTRVPWYTVALDEPVTLSDGQMTNVVPALLERDLRVDGASS